MVRLVSSRVHRCYSRSRGQSSARNERLIDIFHLLACTAVLFDKNFIPGFAKAESWGSIAISAPYLVLMLIQLLDFYASLIAHRMFYSWTQSRYAPRSFLSTPSTVDGVSTCFYFIGYVMHLVASSGCCVPTKGLISLAGQLFLLLGVMSNLILSTPSLDFRLPSAMSRAQNAVLAFFLIGIGFNVEAAALNLCLEERTIGHELFSARSAALGAALIWFGSAMNLLRVGKFMLSVQIWISEELRNRSEAEGNGIFSWFRPSKQDYISDLDSDDLEAGDFDSDDEGPEYEKGWRRV